MKRTFCWIILPIIVCFGFSLEADAQTNLISIDHVDGELPNGDTILVNTPIIFHIRMSNNSGEPLTGSTNGFKIYSPDGAEWGSSLGMSTGAIDNTMYQAFFVNETNIDGIGADTVGFGGFSIFQTGILDGFDEIIATIEIGPINASFHKKTICIDSTYYPPSNTWLWTTDTRSIEPDWTGPHCYKIFDPDAPDISNLIISTDSIHFEGISGGANPASQTFEIASDGSPLSFSLTENADWFYLSPTGGTTNRNITVLTNITGLSPGSYIDTIDITAPEADNSPQQVIVTMNLIPPPPEISVSETQFFFNAVAGETNPNDKFFTVDNSGGSVLNWTVSNNETWLNLSPASGTDLGVVTLSVDITGIPFGEYDDTITVSDPAATNDPVNIPVHLSVGSDLPIIEVDSLVQFVIVPIPTTSVDPRTIKITNAGAGLLNFWVEESSSRILALSPTSGGTPGEVEVTFKVAGGTDGVDYFDTVWVFSDQAINSPVPVVFIMHYTSNPSVMVVTEDIVRLDIYECSMGARSLLPIKSFLVDNIGGDDPLSFSIEYESDYFTLSQTEGIAPQLILVESKYLDLPLGTYFDTITVIGKETFGSVNDVIVQFSVLAGDQTPEIVLSRNSFTIPIKENSGPTREFFLVVENRFGGCMPWTLQETIPWFEPTDTSGEVTGSTQLGANSSGYPFGQYIDSFQILADGAANSPETVVLTLKVWKFHGDWDYSGEINIVDLVTASQFFFRGGPGPMPELKVGDLNCDNIVNIVDLTYFVSYMFKTGAIPCGNPSK